MASDIARTVERLNLQHVIGFEGRAAHEQVIQGLMEASVGLIPFRAVPNHLIIIPTKLFEYMMCAVPVVASDLPPIRRYVTEVDCGLLVPPENPAAFAEAVGYLLDHPEEAQRMGRNGRQAVLSRYNWAAEERKLLSLYKELLG
jgi:glycosyltransferase involved in cell wall biosynthesis